MRNWILTATTLALAAGMPLAAQGASLGLAAVLGAPTGVFNSTTYGDGSTETYDPALGLQFTASFPMDRALALRLNLTGMNFSGHRNDANPPGYRYRAQDSMFSLGGEAQVFLGDGNAMRHTGSYLIGGLSLDLERFDISVNDPNNFDALIADTVTKSRLGLEAGFGHSFRYYGRMRWTLEAVYHKTLTGTAEGDPPASDFVKISYGVVF